MTEEKTPYLKCLWHESKKAYKIYAVVLGIIGVIVGLGYVAWSTKDEIIKDVSTVPLWVYAVVGIISAPFVYAAVKCLWIRGNKKCPWIVPVVFIIFGGFVIAVAMVSHDPNTTNDWYGLETFVVGMIMVLFGIGISMKCDLT
jgi:hypothetical protein